MELDLAKCAGLSADEPIAATESTLTDVVPTDGHIDGQFPPLKSCLSDVVEYPDSIGQVPGDIHLLGCAEDEAPLRSILNPSGDWAYHVNPMSYPFQIPRALSEIEQEIENFWTPLQVPVRVRLSPFVRHVMSKCSDFDFWHIFIGAFETLDEFGSSRAREGARVYICNLGDLPILRDGRRCIRNIVFGKPMALDDCATLGLLIAPLCFAIVDYGDLMPTAGELHRILGRTDTSDTQAAFPRR